jgi:hypothetical protein
VAELSFADCPISTPFPELDETVRQTLVELAECQPEAVELMRGRTFARALH